MPEPKPSNHRCNVLSAEQVLDIRARAAKEGVTQNSLAHEFGVSRMTISHIVRRVTWKNLEAPTEAAEATVDA